MNTTQELKVIDKVTKLLALARDKGVTEHEASAFTAKAQELMAEYNIELATVAHRGVSGGPEGTRVRERMTHRTVYKWQHALMRAIGEVNYVRARERYERSDKNWRQIVFQGYDLIGRKSNVLATQGMFDYLTSTIDRLARAFVEFDGRRVFTAPACRFREGCAERITERLNTKARELLAEQTRKEREARTRAAHPGAAPLTENVPVVFADYITMENDLNNDFFFGWEPGTTARERAEAEARYRERVTVQAKVHPLVPETAAARARRERQSQRHWDAYQKRRDRERSRDAQRRAAPGYREGSEAGEHVGLDPQVQRSKSKRLT